PDVRNIHWIEPGLGSLCTMEKLEHWRILYSTGPPAGAMNPTSSQAPVPPTYPLCDPDLNNPSSRLATFPLSTTCAPVPCFPAAPNHSPVTTREPKVAGGVWKCGLCLADNRGCIGRGAQRRVNCWACGFEPPHVPFDEKCYGSGVKMAVQHQGGTCAQADEETAQEPYREGRGHLRLWSSEILALGCRQTNIGSGRERGGADISRIGGRRGSGSGGKEGRLS
ncbi:unnamed protein product, partial [Discosporangium mesarthrocarpum]